MTKAEKTVCPCAVETAEQLTAGPEPHRVVTLVHGTFAKHAPWMREGPLYEALQPEESKASPRTLLSRFCWSGKNSHTDRLKAGNALAERLRGLIEKFPKARHFVIGHSHGGNVALYALKDEALANRLSGLVTLATPFLTLRRRKLHPLILVAVLILFVLVLLEAAFTLTAADRISLESSMLFSVAALCLVWLFGSLLSAWLYRGREFGMGALFRLLMPGVKAKDEILIPELERMKLTPMQSGKTLVVRPLGDEASMGLVVSQFFSWAQNLILGGLSSAVSKFLKIGWLSWLWKVVVVIVVALVLWDKMPATAERVGQLSGWIGKELPFAGGIVGMIPGLLLGVALILAVLGVVSLVGLLGLLAAALAVGKDAMFWSHFASTTAESSPPGPARVYLQTPPPLGEEVKPGLAHSKIYSDSKVIEEILGWIRLRESTPADAVGHQ